MIEITSEFMNFMSKGMYGECARIVLIKIKDLMLSKIAKKDKEFFSKDINVVMNKYLELYRNKSILEELATLTEENEEDDQVERVSKLLDIYSKIEES